MARIAGVTAEETRRRVLTSAASVFARKGYDGASIADIASAAGVSGGAIYAHFPSKAELFAATLHAHGAAEVERLLAVGGSGADALRVFEQRGIAMGRRDPREGSLLVEAIVAAKRHPDVATLLVGAFAERERRVTELLLAGQQDGTIARSIRPAAVSRFMVMLVLGSLLAAAMELPAVDEDDWAELVTDLVARFHARQPAT